MNLQEGLNYIDNIEDLSAMPSIALDLMALLNDPTSTLKMIVDKVQLDQAMISYILKNCNSPLYGVRTEVTSIATAINLLGFTNLKSILMAYFMRNLYQLSGRNDIKNYLWKHSISVAVFSRLLAEKLRYDRDEAYLSGLLHDVGKMVLYLDNPKEYEKIVKQVIDNKEDFIEIEKKSLTYTHSQVGYFLMHKWKFSQQLKEVTLNHHEPPMFEGDNKFTMLVHFANELTHQYLEDLPGDIKQFQSLYNLSEKDLDLLVADAIQQIEELSLVI